MPGEKLSPCPKGEKRDQKTKKCVKKPPPKKRSPKRNTIKKNSPKSSNSRSSSQKSPKNAPLLSKIKPHISKYNYEYLDETILLLIDVADTDKGKWEYINNSPTRYFFLDSKKVIALIQKDIDSIKKHHKARNYHFLIESCPILIKELEKYIKYIKHHTDKEGYINSDYIERLFK